MNELQKHSSQIDAASNEHAISRFDIQMCKQFENGHTNLTDGYREGPTLNFTSI